MNFIFQGDKPVQTNNVVGVQNVTQLQRNIGNVIGKRDELNRHIGGYNGNISYQNFQLENMFNNITLQSNNVQQSQNLTIDSSIIKNDNSIIKDNTTNAVVNNNAFHYPIQPNMIHSTLLDFNEKLRQEEVKATQQSEQPKEDENKEVEQNAVQEIIDKMESHPDPRMKSSSFLSFMKSLNNKEISLNEQENTIETNNNPIPNQEKMNEIWNKISTTIDNMPISTFIQSSSNTLNHQEEEEIDIQSLFEKAKQLIDDNNDSMALSLLNKIIKKDPSFYQAYLLSCLCNLNEGSEQETIKNILLYLKNNPTFTSLYTSNIYLSPDYVDYSLDPEKIDYSSNLSYSTYEKNKSNIYNAIITFLSNPAIQKGNDVLLITALSYIGLDNHPKAEEFLLQAVHNDSQDYAAYNRLGAFYANNKEYNKALEMYNKALAIKGDYPRLLINMGISLMNLEDYSNSARHFIKALKINKNIEEAWNYLTGIFLSMERGDLVNKIASRNLNDLDLNIQ